jgi:2-dehydro-3-deoxygluconokinase
MNPPSAFIKSTRPAEKAFASFGEIMLRLAPPGFERLLQSPRLDATFGGGEANVAVSLALHGLKARFITALPDNGIGRAAERALRGHGVDTSRILYRKDSRMGIYFLERGADQRPSGVIYDRAGSAINSLGEGDIDWAGALDGCGWFHMTGITPALSENALAQALAAARAAAAAGLVISCDLNFRLKLWNYGRAAREVMPEFARLARVLIANEEDCQKALGIGSEAGVERGPLDRGRYERITGEVMRRYPDLLCAAVTLRESRSASSNRWSACLRTGKEFLVSRAYDIDHIVDRVGAGDAFAAGLIYGLCAMDSEQEALDYAVAASCLKHSIEGDFNLATPGEIRALLAGEASGRIQR